MAAVAAVTDEELVARAVAGDERAFEGLVERHQQRAYGLARRLLGSESDAQDVLQEAFLSVYRKLPSFRGDARFSTWLYRIVTNAALMHRRARARRSRPMDGFLPRFDRDGRLVGEPAELEAAAHAVERLDRKALAKKAQAGVERLPELYRTAFVLRDLEELTTDEVAEMLGVGADVVRQRVHRARLMLRGYLGGAVEGAR